MNIMIIKIYPETEKGHTIYFVRCQANDKLNIAIHLFYFNYFFLHRVSLNSI